MDELSKARAEINDIDDKIASLFEQRMRAVEKVIVYKLEHDMAIFDAKREQEVIAKNINKVTSRYQPYYVQYLQMMMDISKKYQKKIMEEKQNG